MLDQAFEALETYDWGVDPKVLQAIEDAIISNPADAAKLEARMIAVLGSPAPVAAKDAVCRMLRTIGSTASVPALAALLADEKLFHMACYAMERMPAQEAGQAMRTALPRAAGKQKIGLIGALGVRGEADSVEPLRSLLAAGDPTIATAAALALGEIGSLAAAEALVAAEANAGAKLAIGDASLACAEKLLASGNKSAAKAIYEKLLSSDPAKQVQVAATSGLLACASK